MSARRSVPWALVGGVCLWVAHFAVTLRAAEPVGLESPPLAWSGRTKLAPVHVERRPQTGGDGWCSLPSRSTNGRANIELWAVSTRHLSPAGCAAMELAGLQYFRFDGQVWQPEAWPALANSWQQPLRTCIYIHGNNSSFEGACAHGLALAAAWERLTPHAGRVRLVIWCWPSDRLPVDRPTNARIKADWAEQQGFHVARFLAQLPPRAGVSLWGHSYGARVCSAALHLLGGGTLDGRSSTGGPWAGSGRLRAVLTGAALEDGWLLPGERHGAATRAAEKILVVINPCDAVLWLFPLLPKGGGGPPALGLAGLPQDPRRCEVEPHVDHLDVSGTLGLGHVSQRYLECPEVIRQIKIFLLRECVTAPGDAHASRGSMRR